MGLIKRLDDKIKTSYKNLSNWLDKHLSKDLPQGIVAINFNLYEGEEQTYDIELVGCGSFDEDNGDWACDEIFTTREDLLFIPKTKKIASCEQGLLFITSLMEKYLLIGDYADKLKSYTAIGIGFVDGDIDVLYRSE